MLHSRMMRSALFPTGGLNAPPRPLAIACGRSPAARPQSPVMREIYRTGGTARPGKSRCGLSVPRSAFFVFEAQAALEWRNAQSRRPAYRNSGHRYRCQTGADHEVAHRVRTRT